MIVLYRKSKVLTDGPQDKILDQIFVDENFWIHSNYIAYLLHSIPEETF